MKELAPIVLFVYNRPDHTKRTVESLSKNTLSELSKLFIYSDGPKNNSDAAKVNIVRRYIHSIQGFNKIEIIEREKNFGLAKSVIEGVSEIFNLYEKVIVIEDDIVSSETFLRFMNEALSFYECNEKIFSVSGYAYPLKIPTRYNHDVFVAYRASSWGWATWKDRWEKADWEMRDFQDFKKDRNAKKKFNCAGEDLTPMLFNQMKGKIDSWAIRWTYTHFKFDAYCLFPVKALCKNIGTDSSGTHSATSNKFDIQLDNSSRQIKFTNEFEIDEEITRSIKKFFQPSVFRRILNFL